MNSQGAKLPASVAENVADTMFALATPSRVQILHILMAASCTAGELTERLGMEQSAVSHQLRILREHGLVRAEWFGRRRVYSLSDDRVRTLLEAALEHVMGPSGPAESTSGSLHSAGTNRVEAGPA